MAKAKITTKTGAQISLEGSKEEIAELIAMIEGDAGAKSGSTSRRQTSVTKKAATSKGRPTLNSLISELIDGGFFKKPKELGAIKLALEEQGHFYPATTLSPVLLRMVRRKQLRRIKDNNRWLYVG